MIIIIVIITIIIIKINNVIIIINIWANTSENIKHLKSIIIVVIIN